MNTIKNPAKRWVGQFPVRRSISAGVMIFMFVSLMINPRAALAHVPGVTQRVSVDSLGNEGDGASGISAISADGRFVAFGSSATNLIAGGNLPFGIFVHDRQTGSTEIVSVSSRGRQGEGSSSAPDISDDGRFVAFDSDAANLVRGDRNNITDVFRHDRETGETILVSVSSDGQQGDSSSHAPAISADGNLIVFHANSPLVPEDNNETTDVYIRDVEAGTTALVSVASDETIGNSSSFIQEISADGRFVVFVSSATNLVENDLGDID